MKRLYRSTTDKKIAGVFGGVGEMLNIDSTLIRLLMVFAGLATGIIPLVITYLIAAWIIPPKDKGTGVS
jgi:phage shock protein C